MSKIERVAGIGNPGHALRFRIDGADIPKLNGSDMLNTLYATQEVDVCPGAKYRLRYDFAMPLGDPADNQHMAAIAGYIPDSATGTRSVVSTLLVTPSTLAGNYRTLADFERVAPTFVVPDGVYRRTVAVGVYSFTHDLLEPMDVYIDNARLVRIA
jgi:hypothetical protein